MLVLTRKPGQSVFIGDTIKVTLHGVRGNQVRIGIEAPNNVRIYREEIYYQIMEENQSAATESPKDLGDIAKAWQSGRSKAITELSKTSKALMLKKKGDDEEIDE